jgi:hypothetical protein
MAASQATTTIEGAVIASQYTAHDMLIAPTFAAFTLP